MHFYLCYTSLTLQLLLDLRLAVHGPGAERALQVVQTHSAAAEALCSTAARVGLCALRAHRPFRADC